MLPPHRKVEPKKPLVFELRRLLAKERALES
jgi:hypothetical protein